MSLRSEIDNLEQSLMGLRQRDIAALGDVKARFDALRREADVLLRRQAELAALYEIARELASVVDRSEQLQLILARAITLVQAERGFIVLTDDSAVGFHIAVARQYAADDREDADAQISRSLIRRVLSTRSPVVTTNAQEDPRFQSATSIVSYRIRSVMGVPLVYEKEVLGAIYVDTRISSRLFNQDDLELLRAMANQAATAIHVARLYTHLETRNRQLQNALSELRATQDELIRSERLSAVGRLASGIIHDFKTPMTTIKGYASFLGRDDLPADDRVRFSSTVVAAVDGLVGMAQEVLDFVHGGGEIHTEPVALRGFVAEITDFLKDEFAERNIQIDTDLAYDGWMIIDKAKMRRVIMNIASNTRDALGDRGGIFFIRSRLENRSIVLMLADNGPGIPADIQTKIFEPFVTSGKAHGTGLGLAICKKIVEDHGGSIRLRSEASQGAAFVITLPHPERS